MSLCHLRVFACFSCLYPVASVVGRHPAIPVALDPKDIFRHASGRAQARLELVRGVSSLCAAYQYHHQLYALSDIRTCNDWTSLAHACDALVEVERVSCVSVVSLRGNFVRGVCCVGLGVTH